MRLDLGLVSVIAKVRRVGDREWWGRTGFGTQSMSGSYRAASRNREERNKGFRIASQEDVLDYSSQSKKCSLKIYFKIHLLLEFVSFNCKIPIGTELQSSFKLLKVYYTLSS